jgi:hypothetical protein
VKPRAPVQPVERPRGDQVDNDLGEALGGGMVDEGLGLKDVQQSLVLERLAHHGVVAEGLVAQVLGDQQGYSVEEQQQRLHPVAGAPQRPGIVVRNLWLGTHSRVRRSAGLASCLLGPLFNGVTVSGHHVSRRSVGIRDDG